MNSSIHSSLTWTLCEVVKAAVFSSDAAFITVACAVHTVHPPVSGQTVCVSASAALPWTTSTHQVVLT